MDMYLYTTKCHNKSCRLHMMDMGEPVHVSVNVIHVGDNYIFPDRYKDYFGYR